MEKDASTGNVSKHVFPERYYPSKFPETEPEKWKSGLSEEELTDVMNAIYDNEITINVQICLFDYEHYKIFVITFGEYKDKSLYFQQREDYGLILHSIIWKTKKEV